MQILCQPFFLLNPLILGIYYVLKIRRLQCYKYTFVLQVFDESAPAEEKVIPKQKQVKSIQKLNPKNGDRPRFNIFFSHLYKIKGGLDESAPAEEKSFPNNNVGLKNQAPTIYL